MERMGSKIIELTLKKSLSSTNFQRGERIGIIGKTVQENLLS
jgi:hypothetical protein